MESGDLQRLYALHPSGAERIHLDPIPDPFYSLYKRVEPGIYEAARTYGKGRIFAYEAHERRLENGIAAMGYEPALTDMELRQALQQAMDDFPVSPIKLRWDLGPKPFTEIGTDARMIATLVPRPVLPDWVYEDGVTLSLNTDLRRLTPVTKGAAFAIERNRVPYGTRDHYEPVMVDEKGYLLEGVMSNFGALIGNRLHTNPEGVLPGVTIRTIMQLARKSGLEVVREPIHRDQLADLDEAFLCSAVRGIVSAVRIDGQVIGAGLPGPRVQALAAAYSEYADSHAQRVYP
ncbi:MAG: aminotransferase class IV [Planctomycetes bacterium]|nr:aminotransferase class IV [Planctomycetota bacterium]